MARLVTGLDRQGHGMHLCGSTSFDVDFHAQPNVGSASASLTVSTRHLEHCPSFDGIRLATAWKPAHSKACGVTGQLASTAHFAQRALRSTQLIWSEGDAPLPRSVNEAHGTAA